MKLQYLGDSRDAFKWDLLHHLCVASEPPFSRLLYVPMLTADDTQSSHGRTSHELFTCKTEIRGIISALNGHPRSFDPLRKLGELDRDRRYEVMLYQQEKFLGNDSARSLYWCGLKELFQENTIVFLDPDNGFESPSCTKEKWVLHREVEWILKNMRGRSVILIYQHRPREKWSDYLKKLTRKLTYASRVYAAYESNFAFIALAADGVTGSCLSNSMSRYCDANSAVHFSQLLPEDS